MPTGPSRPTVLVGTKQSNDHVSVPAFPTFPPLHSRPPPHRTCLGSPQSLWLFPSHLVLLQARDMPRISRRFEPRRPLYAITRSLTVRGALHRWTGEAGSLLPCMYLFHHAFHALQVTTKTLEDPDQARLTSNRSGLTAPSANDGKERVQMC